MQLARFNHISRIFQLTLIILLQVFCTSTAFSALPQRMIEGQMQVSLAPVIKQATPAVVNIATYSVQRSYSLLFQSPFFRHFFGIPDTFEESRQMQSAGSGVIVDAKKGYVLTNHHVIAGSNDIEVNLQDGRKFEAKLIGSDEKVDIALLQIDAEDLIALDIADSSQLQVGDFVIAIGNPFGLGQTVTSGIVSALGRNGLGIQGYEDFIQTDASINPGNSGGALIDLNGRLVGINSAIIAPAGGNVGIGFAIPTEVTNSIMTQLIEYGQVRRGGIGAHFQDLTAELAETFELDTFQGALVSKIAPDSSAEDAGLRQGDIIVKANDRLVRNASDIHNRIGLSPIGQELELEILRDGDSKTLTVEIAPIPIPSSEGHFVSPYLSGALLEDLIPPDQEDAIGVIVKDLDRGGRAAQIGLEVGDIIFGINRTRTHSLKEMKQYLESRKPQAFRIRRGYEDLIVYLR